MCLKVTNNYVFKVPDTEGATKPFWSNRENQIVFLDYEGGPFLFFRGDYINSVDDNKIPIANLIGSSFYWARTYEDIFVVLGEANYSQIYRINLLAGENIALTPGNPPACCISVR